MAHEETADLLRSARTKILRNSIFRQRGNTEIEFRKNFDRVLPLQGLAAKAVGRLYERHKFGNGLGQLKGALTHGCPAQRCRMLASRLMSASPPSGSMSRPRLVSTVTCGRARLLPTSHIACPRGRHGDRTAAFRLFAISDDAARLRHRLRAFDHSPGSARPSERSLSARYTAIGKRPARTIGAGFIIRFNPAKITRRQEPSTSRKEYRKAPQSDPAKRNVRLPPRPVP